MEDHYVGKKHKLLMFFSSQIAYHLHNANKVKVKNLT